MYAKEPAWFVEKLIVKLPPSLTLATERVSEYVGIGVVEVSLIVTELLVACMVPLVDPVRRYTVNVSVPSVVVSAVGLTEKDPVLPLIVNEPLVVPKSPELVAILQYSVVPSGTFVVLTLNVPELPSLMLEGIVPNA